VVNSNELIITEITKNKIYSFKVAALNKGGESFPSEILSVAISENASKPILIVNGFDRIEGPEYVESENFKGFVKQLDQGVPYQFDFTTTGDQHDFNPKSQWIDDDCPGFGASYADEEGIVHPGNTFDFPYIHGQAILNNGYSFVSMIDEAFTESLIKSDDYLMVDMLMGEEKKKADYTNSKSSTYKIFTNHFVTSLEKLAESKIPVFISGSYIGKEIGTDTILIKKIGRLLGYKFLTDHSVKNGNVYFTDKNDMNPKTFEFATKYNKLIYSAESPDAIESYNSKSKTIIRYSENNMGAGVFGNDLNKTIALAFPFECILSDKERENMMKMIIEKLVK
jgi:hypothetical protein